MKTIFAIILLFLSIVARAANPTFASFPNNQFSNDGRTVALILPGTNIVPINAVFDVNGAIAVPGFTVGQQYFYHKAIAAEDFGVGSTLKNGASTVFSSGIFTANSNTMYLTSAPNSPGSNVYARLFMFSTNHFGGYLDGVFNGPAFGPDILTAMSNIYGVIFQTNAPSGVPIVNVNLISDAGGGLVLSGTGGGASHNTVIIQTTNGNGVGYSAYAVFDSAGNEIFASGAQNGNFATTNYLNPAQFPYANGFLEVGTVFPYSWLIVNSGNINAGLLVTNIGGTLYRDWTTFDNTTGSYDAMTNTNAVGTHVLFQSRQERTNVFIRSIQLGAMSNSNSFVAVFTNWIDGFTNYANHSGRPMLIGTPIWCRSTTNVGSFAYEAFYINGAPTGFGYSQLPSTGGSTNMALNTTNGGWTYLIQDGQTFGWTNLSVVSASAGLFNGGWYIIQ